MATSLRREAPSTQEDAAELLRRCGAEGAAVRFTAGGTKAGWGRPPGRVDVELSASGLDRLVEHNEGDLTAVLEAGVPLARAQARFAEADQFLALDPPLGPGEATTIGGLLATADSGPARHRYGAPRDLVIGMRVALSDGTVARSGGKVIKNVAGYDLAKLFTGAFGTLGMILEVAVRLHPLPRQTATAIGRSSRPEALAAAAGVLARSQLEKDALDVAWSQGQGSVLARFGGATALDQARAAGALLAGEGLDPETVEDDDALWSVQREAQRRPGGTVVRVSGLQSQLADLLATADRIEGTLVGRAGLGLSWIAMDGDAETAAARVAELRDLLAPAPCVVQDSAPGLAERLDPWGEGESTLLALSERTKARFDPARICNPGIFIGGI